MDGSDPIGGGGGSGELLAAKTAVALQQRAQSLQKLQGQAAVRLIDGAGGGGGGAQPTPVSGRGSLVDVYA